jgi:hypothetical protein
VRQSIEPSKRHVEAPQQAILTRVDAAMEKIIGEMDSTSFSDEDLLAKLDTISSSMQAAVQSSAPAAAPAAEAAELKPEAPTSVFDPFGAVLRRLPQYAASA